MYPNSPWSKTCSDSHGVQPNMPRDRLDKGSVYKELTTLYRRDIFLKSSLFVYDVSVRFWNALTTVEYTQGSLRTVTRPTGLLGVSLELKTQVIVTSCISDNKLYEKFQDNLAVLNHSLDTPFVANRSKVTEQQR